MKWLVIGVFFYSFWSTLAFSQDLIPYDTSKFQKEDTSNETEGNFQISERYKGGRHLIYDCRGQFFACVNIDSKEACLLSRQRSKEKGEEMFRCAPLKTFVDKESCLRRNYEVVEEVHLKRFCFPKSQE